MEPDCLAFSKDASCVTVNPADNPDVTVIASSVGAGGANVPTDVRTIQAALNDVPSGRGGPNPALKVDGVVGPLTLAAIKRFQQTHVRVVDSRIDPNGSTLAALNAELDGNVPVVAQGQAAAAAPARRRKPEFLPPDPEIIATVATMLVKVRDVIRAANFQLITADRFVITNQKLTAPTGPFQAIERQSLNLLDTVFSLGRFNNPRPPFENIKRVFRNMDVALNRSFETAPLIAPVLFVPNTHISMEVNAAAYTSVGGAFIASNVKLKGLGEPADRIYVCRSFLTDTRVNQVSALVHELAHYVSGQPTKIGDVVKKGRMLNSVDRPHFDAIRPEDKIKSGEHYSFFAIVARFPRFLSPN